MNNLKQQIEMHNAKIEKDKPVMDYVILPREYIDELIEGLETMLFERCDRNEEFIHEILTYLEEIKLTK